MLILEHIPPGGGAKRQAAWVNVSLRTLLYSAGVVAALALEKGVEGRHEHGGFGGAVVAALQSTAAHHVWANAICITGALLNYNVVSVIRPHLGEGGLIRLLTLPIPPEKHSGTS